MHEFLRLLDAEIADLERQLSASPIYVKLQRAKNLRDAYLITDGAETSVAAPRHEAVRHARPLASGNSAAVLEVVKSHLRGKTRPVPTRDIMSVLKDRGVEVGGAIPQNNVSSLLSKANDIVSHGRLGWTLADHDMEKAGDATLLGASSPASVSTSTPVEPGEEVAHDNTDDLTDILGERL